MSIFNDVGIDVKKGTEILNTLEVDIDDLTTIPVYRKIKEILKFFKNRENPAREIRRILKPGVDVIEHTWVYTEIWRELYDNIKKIKQYNDVLKVDDIVDDYIENKKIDKLFKDLKMNKTIEKEKKEEIEKILKETKNLKKEIDILWGK